MTEKINEELFESLMDRFEESDVDYTIFFRELSEIPTDIQALTRSFYDDSASDAESMKKWSTWHASWVAAIGIDVASSEARATLSNKMRKVNPKYTLREWFLVPAYRAANKGGYGLIEELQRVVTNPYEEQSAEVAEKFDGLKPEQLCGVAGFSHMSCSS